MATFSLSRPQSMYANEPDYLQEGKLGLALLGYKPTGEQNTWGKINSWMGTSGITTNALARGYAEKRGATDTWENIKEDTDNRMKKLGVQAGVAMSVAGGITGNPQMVGQGLNMTSNFAGQLAFDQNTGLTDDSEYIYR